MTAASIWLTGPGAEAARTATMALLEDAGLRATPARPDDDARTLARLAEAGVVAVGAGEPPEGAPSPATVDASAPDGPRRALAAADHSREVASRPIFVVGAGRSGTTWAYDLLAAHPRVRGLLATRMLVPENLGFLRPGNRFDPAPVGIPGERETAPIGMGQLVGRPAVVAATRASAIGWLAAAIGPEHDFLVEKTPGHAGSLPAVADLFPQARVVHVLRDVRDVLVSRRAAIASGWWEDEPSRTPLATRVAREWTWLLDRVDEARDRVAVHDLRYERLHVDPVGQLSAAFAFCGIPHDDDLVRSIVEANAIDRAPVRGETRFRRGGRVGDHRTRLSRADRLLVAAQAGPALAAHGYTTSPGAAHRAVALAGRARGALRRLTLPA